MFGGRYSIALLVANITDPFSFKISAGAMRAAEKLGADLTIFPGKYLGLHDNYDLYDTTYEYQYNVLFGYAAEGGFDYIISVTGTIAYALDNDMKLLFLKSLGDTPVLSVAAELDGFDSLCFDNASGITAVVDELAAQGRKHFGFMAGDLNNSECAERYRAFCAGLEKHGIDFPERCLMTSDISEMCRGEIYQLLDRAPELDAIVCINDIIARTVCNVLKERGIVVGKDIAVTGFDDLYGSAELDPPLATVRADAEKLGERAVEKVINKLKGIKDDSTRMPTEFIIRESISRAEYPGKQFEKLTVNERQLLREQAEERIHTDNIFVRDAMMFSADVRHSYAKAIKQLSLTGALNGFIYTLEEPVTHRSTEKFPQGLSWRFRSYSYGDETFTVPDEYQKMTMPEVFSNRFLCPERRHCFIAADLYAADTQYGLALLEPRDTSFFSELELVTYILSSAVRTLDILSRQEKLLGRLKTMNLALEKESQIDALTGIYNRRGFYHAADDLFEKAGGESEYLICYADMDNLKLVNDIYGHTEGDYSLRLVAECLRMVFGENAVVGRLGGDEYAVIASCGALSPEQVVAKKDRFVEEFNSSGAKPYRFGISVGVLKCACGNGYDLKAALDKADDLLYVQKQRRKKEL